MIIHVVLVLAKELQTSIQQQIGLGWGDAMKMAITILLIGAGIYYSADFGMGKAVHMSATTSNYQQDINGNSQ